MFKKRGYLFIALIPVAFVAIGFITMYLWNWLMPVLFHLPEITFWQTAGLLILSRLLLGGFGAHRRGHSHHQCKRNMQEKWEHMTPDEREKFQEHIHLCRPPWNRRNAEDDRVKEC